MLLDDFLWIQSNFLKRKMSYDVWRYGIQLFDPKEINFQLKQCKHLFFSAECQEQTFRFKPYKIQWIFSFIFVIYCSIPVNGKVKLVLLLSFHILFYSFDFNSFASQDILLLFN